MSTLDCCISDWHRCHRLLRCTRRLYAVAAVLTTHLQVRQPLRWLHGSGSTTVGATRAHAISPGMMLKNPT